MSQIVNYFRVPTIGFCPFCIVIGDYQPGKGMICPSCRRDDLSLFTWDRESPHPQKHLKEGSDSPRTDRKPVFRFDELRQAEPIREKLDKLHEVAMARYEAVLAQREKLLEAFIAETGLRPSEIVLVEQQTPDGEPWPVHPNLKKI